MRPGVTPIRATALLFGLFLTASIPAQVVADVPLPPGLPQVFEGPAFAKPAALALFGGEAVHVWTGLPEAPHHTRLDLGGAYRPVERWYRLDQGTAAYLAAGADHLAGTADDRLVLVTGLPAAPQVILTTVTGSASTWVAVNESVAVRPVPALQAFEILDHGAATPTIEMLPSPAPLASDPAFGWGALDADGVIGLGCGGDLAAGTADDQLVRVTGLAGANRVVEAFALPAGTQARGFVVTPTGCGAWWEDAGLPRMSVTMVTVDAGQPVFSSRFVTPPAQPDPFGPIACGVRATDDGLLLAWCHDDVGPGQAFALIADPGPLATVVGTWLDDWNGGESSEVVRGAEVAEITGLDPSGFTYTRHAGAATRTFRQELPWDEIAFRRTGSGTLVALSQGLGQPLQDSARALVITDLWGQHLEMTLVASGRWCGGGSGLSGQEQARIVELMPGRLAFFLDPHGGTTPSVMRVLMVPDAPLFPPSSEGVGAVRLSIVRQPGPAPDTMVLTCTVPATWQQPLAWIVATVAARPPLALPQPPFGAGSFLRVDPGTLLGLLPMPMGPGFGQLSLSRAPLASILGGVTVWTQPLVHDGAGTWYLGNLVGIGF